MSRKTLTFKYESDNLPIEKYKIYPFRIGDIVTIRDWGRSYTDYRKANKYFKKVSENPYFSKYVKERKDGIQFKIIDIAEHSSPYCAEIILYLRDRTFRDSIIGAEGVQLIKQFPLRYNEKQNIKLKKI